MNTVKKTQPTLEQQLAQGDIAHLTNLDSPRLADGGVDKALADVVGDAFRVAETEYGKGSVRLLAPVNPETEKPDQLAGKVGLYATGKAYRATLPHPADAPSVITFGW